MPQLPFPQIEGVRFKHIPKFEGYAVSSDGHVWISRRGNWRKMEPYRFCDGEMAVMLRFPSMGASMEKVKDLMALFD